MNAPKEFTPPKFCPDAIASNAGWINPRDNSLIVPNRGLATRMMEWKAKQKAEAEEKRKAVEALAKTLNNIETPAEEPVAKTTRKSKKNSKES